PSPTTYCPCDYISSNGLVEWNKGMTLKFVEIQAAFDPPTPELHLLLASYVIGHLVPIFFNFFCSFFRRHAALHHQREMLIEDIKIGFVAWQHQQRGGILGIFQGNLDKLWPELGENRLVRQIRAPHWGPETLRMSHGLVTFCRSGQPLQEIVRQFGVLAIAVDHIARARRLWRAPHQPATDLHPRHETAELLSFNFALRIGSPIAH